MRNIGRIKDAASLLGYFGSLPIWTCPFDEEVRTGSRRTACQTSHRARPGRSATASPSCPWESWDCTADGRPSDLTRRRWQRWGLSGAKLIFGAEAIAVCPEGRAAPASSSWPEETLADIAGLRDAAGRHPCAALLRRSTTSMWAFSSLTPVAPPAPARYGLAQSPAPCTITRCSTGPTTPVTTAQVMSDGEIERVIADFVKAAGCSPGARASTSSISSIATAIWATSS